MTKVESLKTIKKRNNYCDICAFQGGIKATKIGECIYCRQKVYTSSKSGEGICYGCASKNEACVCCHKKII